MDGDYKARYVPAASVVEDEDQEDELWPSQHYDKRRLTAEMIDIVNNAPIAVRDLVARKGRFHK